MLHGELVIIFALMPYSDIYVVKPAEEGRTYTVENQQFCVYVQLYNNNADDMLLLTLQIETYGHTLQKPSSPPLLCNSLIGSWLELLSLFKHIKSFCDDII